MAIVARLAITALLIFTAGLQAATVSSVTCTRADVTITDPVECLLEGVAPNENPAGPPVSYEIGAHVASSYSITGNQLFAGAEGQTFYGRSLNELARYEASSSIEASFVFYTPGPVRQGIAMILLSELNRGFFVGNPGSTVGVSDSYGDNIFLANCGGTDLFGCFNSHTVLAGGIVQPVAYPFTLGVPFQVTASATGGFGNADSGALSGGDSENANAYISLYELDGVTPVSIADVPEPQLAPLVLLLGALLVIAARRRKSAWKSKTNHGSFR